MAPEGNKLAGRLLDALLALLLPLTALLALRGQTFFATVLLVASMGALGGFLSSYRRTHAVPGPGGPLFTAVEPKSAVILAPLIGAICAVVLFLTFLGGLLKGTLFPDLTKLAFSPSQAEPPALDSRNYGTYGLLLLWSFIAGFAARLVPAPLDHLVLKGAQASTHAAATPGRDRLGGRTELKDENHETRRGIHRV